MLSRWCEGVGKRRREWNVFVSFATGAKDTKPGGLRQRVEGRLKFFQLGFVERAL